MKALLAAAFACAVLLAGCKKAPETETLLIAGSSSMRAYIAPVVAAFVAKNPSLSVVNEGGGSTAGLVALKRGAIDVATLSRPVTAKEDDVYLRDYLVARDGIAVIVNPANPVSELTTQQLARIFDGEIGDWAEVGGSGDKIVLIDHAKKSHVRRSLEDLLLGGEEIAKAARSVSSSAELLAIVRSTPAAIGYTSLHRLGPGVKALRVNGVDMTRATMLSGRYPLARSFYVVLHLKSSPLAERFVEFTLSKQGQGLLASDGLLKVF